MNNNGKTAIIVAAVTSAVAIPTTIAITSSTNKTDTTNTSIVETKKTNGATTNPQPQTEQPEEKTNCVIKGNINAQGEKIYHVPGQKYYDVTVIDTSKGERWFCTENEAVANGWRKSKV